MNDTRRPPACHYDRALAMRVTRDHRDDCPREQGAGDCPAAGRGCAPCTAPHCLVCGRNHATNSEPDTCGECLGKVREDLTQLAADYAALATEAIAGGGDGRLVAAAPIPGGTAAVLRGPTVRLDQLSVSRHTASDHRVNEKGHSKDPIPPLAVLAQWEDMYRAWFDHVRGDSAKCDAYLWHGGRPPSRATVAGAVRYLTEQLEHMANGDVVRQGPDWLAFTRSVRNLRAGLERALHDEQEPERGVECFECGDQLVRRFRDPKRCRHKTPARTELHRALVRQQAGQDWMRTVATYPEVEVMEADLAAARGPSASLVAAARRPCAACQDKQGGLDDPRAGRSWECPGCRKDYDSGEYVNAVRRGLLQDEAGHGWTSIQFAAQAASDVVGMAVSDGLIRKWVERGKVPVACEWRCRLVDGQMRGLVGGQRLVFWPDVVTEANAAVERMLASAEERRVRAAQDAAWRRAVLGEVSAGRRLRPAAKRVGKQLRLHPARVATLLEDLVQELAWRRAVESGERPEVAARRLGIGEARLSELLDTVAA